MNERQSYYNLLCVCVCTRNAPKNIFHYNEMIYKSRSKCVSLFTVCLRACVTVALPDVGSDVHTYDRAFKRRSYVCVCETLIKHWHYTTDRDDTLLYRQTTITKI